MPTVGEHHSRLNVRSYPTERVDIQVPDGLSHPHEGASAVLGGLWQCSSAVVEGAARLLGKRNLGPAPG